jgi:hypothetical protein
MKRIPSNYPYGKGARTAGLLLVAEPPSPIPLAARASDPRARRGGPVAGHEDNGGERHIHVQLRHVRFLADLFIVHVRRDANHAQPQDVGVSAHADAAVDRGLTRPQTLGQARVEHGDPCLRIGSLAVVETAPGDQTEPERLEQAARRRDARRRQILIGGVLAVDHDPHAAAAVIAGNARCRRRGGDARKLTQRLDRTREERGAGPWIVEGIAGQIGAGAQQRPLIEAEICALQRGESCRSSRWRRRAAPDTTPPARLPERPAPAAPSARATRRGSPLSGRLPRSRAPREGPAAARWPEP